MRHNTKKFKEIKYWLNYSCGILIDYDGIGQVYRCRMFTAKIKGRDGYYRLKKLASTTCPKRLSAFVDDLRSTIVAHAKTVMWKAQVEVWKTDDRWWDRWSDVPEHLHGSEDIGLGRIDYDEWVTEKQLNTETT